jgi:hypothetical protein
MPLANSPPKEGAEGTTEKPTGKKGRKRKRPCPQSQGATKEAKPKATKPKKAAKAAKTVKKGTAQAGYGKQDAEDPRDHPTGQVRNASRDHENGRLTGAQRPRLHLDRGQHRIPIESKKKRCRERVNRVTK